MKNEIKSLFSEITAIKTAMKEELTDITQNAQWSEDYKEAKREMARAEAADKLKEVYRKSEDVVSSLKQTTEKYNAFDYGDERLLAAVNFIKVDGAKLPEAAWRQMISDFEGRPHELMYLSSLFDSNKVIDAAITAKEAAKQVYFKESLPDRLSDTIYFACTTDPEADTDFSSIMREVNELQE